LQNTFILLKKTEQTNSLNRIIKLKIKAMKQNFLKLTCILGILLLAVGGCTKDDTKPDPVTKVVSPGKQITYFKIVTPAITGVIDTVNKAILVTVPTGTNVTSLSTDISLAAGHSINPKSGAAQNFSAPVIYTVTRPDKTTTQWTVAVGSSAVEVNNDITSSVTWTADKIYNITGDVNLDNNSVLTIQPGTVVRFNAGASLTIGYSSNATLIANGTAEKPIIFTSTAVAPAAGAWKGLFFDEHTLNNTSLAYCSIMYAGSNSNYGALNVSACDISVSHCNISLSGAYGVYTYYANNLGGFSTFENNTISTTNKYGMVINAQKLGSLGTGNVFTNCFGVLISGDFRSTTAQVWKNLGISYIVENEVDIDGSLTIEAGAAFKFEAAGWLAVGYNTASTFVADGTATLPIKFTSNASSPVAGSWRGLTFYGNTQTNSRINNCILEYAGSNASYGALHLADDASITFTNNIIRNSSSYGIVVDANAGFQSFSGNTISSCVNHLISIPTKHLPELGSPNTFTAETGKGILVSGDVQYSSDVTWKKQTADFYFTGGEIDVDGNVTIEAGSKFMFINDTYFWFGYNANTKITAIGTALAKITFTSSASSPAAGAWRGIYFDSFTQTNTQLSYCDFQYTGMSGKPAIYTEKPIGVAYTTIGNYSSTHAAEYKTGITLLLGLGNNFTWAAN
jgi:hypothetical protein